MWPGRASLLQDLLSFSTAGFLTFYIPLPAPHPPPPVKVKSRILLEYTSLVYYFTCLEGVGHRGQHISPRVPLRPPVPPPPPTHPPSAAREEIPPGRRGRKSEATSQRRRSLTHYPGPTNPHPALSGLFYFIFQFVGFVCHLPTVRRARIVPTYGCGAFLTRPGLEGGKRAGQGGEARLLGPYSLDQGGRDLFSLPQTHHIYTSPPPHPRLSPTPSVICPGRRTRSDPTRMGNETSSSEPRQRLRHWHWHWH